MDGWNITEYNGMCLFGFGRWRAERIRLESPVLGRKDSVGKSGAWPKRFGWKVRRLAEKIRLESPVLGRKDSVGNMINLRKILGLKLEK